MKKLKIGFGEGGFQGFMARHVEKCVLVAVILLMAWFIYSGTGASTLDANITKENLKKSAQQAESQITNSKWDLVAPDRAPRTNADPFRIVVTQTGKIDSRSYAYKAWDVPLVPRLLPRLDPKVIAAEKLIVTPLYGPLALMAPEGDEDSVPIDPLDKYPVVLGGQGGGMAGYQGSGGATMPGSDPKEKGKKTREPKGPMGTSPMGPSPMGTASTKQPKKKKGDSPYESSAATYPSMGSSFTGPKARMISPEATEGLKAPQGSLLQPRHAMVICAVVPFRKQWDEFREAFKDAPGGQDPVRDVPEYIAVWVDVLDVTDDPSMDPATAKGWKRVKSSDLVKIENEYAAEVQELADPDALDPLLTHPVPPFLLTDLQPVMLHPDVPRATNVLERIEDDDEIDTDLTEEGEIIKDSTTSGASGGTRGKGYQGTMGGMPRPGGAGGRPYAGQRQPGAGKQGMGQPGLGGGNRAGYSGMDFETYRPVAKKLLRFVDFDAEPGRKYRYRVQLVLNDPNHPEDPAEEPEPTSLSEAARERVKTLDAAAAKSGKRKYWITSPVSEPSDIVSMPASERFYAGETVPAATVNIAGATIATNEPVAKVLTVTWDPKLGVFAPAEQTAHRASVLNMKGDVEVLHPVMGDLRKIKDYELRTEGVVLDILGGDKLPGSTDSKETVRAPGETLILDANGNFVVTDESRDIEGYRKYIFPEPKEEAASKETGSSSMQDSMAPPGYPEAKGSKTGKSRSGASPYSPKRG